VELEPTLGDGPLERFAVGSGPKLPRLHLFGQIIFVLRGCVLFLGQVLDIVFEVGNREGPEGGTLRGLPVEFDHVLVLLLFQ